ncbi:MAG: transcriptional repressor LexA [Paludibacter sp.]|nr:transcriptional repressor LexA [Paludibacter sp.]
MRTKNFELMQRICKFAENFILENNRSPSTTEIADAVGIARGTAYRYLVEMDERNLIEYDGHSIQTEVTQKYKTKLSQAAIVGSIPCGSPQYEEEHIEAYVSLPESIFGSGEFYILRASGDSMIEAGIDDGDLVVIKKQQTAYEGDIVVALVDGQNTLKRYYIDSRKKRVCLHPENKTMEDIYVNECEIQGVAQHVIKAL